MLLLTQQIWEVAVPTLSPVSGDLRWDSLLADCIVEWLERSHLCSFRQNAMPTVEVEAGEPSNLSRPRLWDLFMMSAGGILSAFAKLKDNDIRILLCIFCGSAIGSGGKLAICNSSHL